MKEMERIYGYLKLSLTTRPQDEDEESFITCASWDGGGLFTSK
jgi:hypothetical protein